MTTRGRGSGPALPGATMTPLEWFQLLYPGADAGWLTLSYKRDATTRQVPDDPFRTEWLHVANLELAAQRAEVLAQTHDVYNGLGLRRERLAEGQRGTSQDVAALPGLWVEVDCSAGTHAGSSKRYFPSKEKAQAFLEGLPHVPTAVVDSGGGLHAYWLFRELWVLDADEQDYAAALLRGWQGYIHERAQVEGYAVDSTHDLARVLRPAGTWNRKNGHPLQVQALRVDGPRCNPGDFDEWADYAARQTGGAATFTLRRGAQPPAMKFAAMRENDRKFRDTWDGKRRDLHDTSPSAVCMALASIAAMAGWSDQEIVDLMAAWRDQAGAKPKPAGWYGITLAKARQSKLAAGPVVQSTARLDDAVEPDEKLATLSQLLGFRVIRLVRLFILDPSGATTDPSYVLETDAGKVRFDTVDDLLTRQRFVHKIAGHIQRVVEVGTKEWPAVKRALVAVAVTEEAPLETSEYEQVRQNLAEYLETRGVCDDPVHAHDGHMALRLDGQVWFSLSQFGEWCRVRKGSKAGPRNLPTLLAAIGSRKRVIDNLLRGGKRAKLAFWSAP